MSDQPTRGGRRPGAGRKPGQGTGPNPEVRERVMPELAAYCKARQAAEPGYLARLLWADYTRPVSLKDLEKA